MSAYLKRKDEEPEAKPVDGQGGKKRRRELEAVRGEPVPLLLRLGFFASLSRVLAVGLLSVAYALLRRQKPAIRQGRLGG